MASNVEQVGSNDPSEGGGPSSTSTRIPIDGLSDGSDPPATLQSSTRPDVGSKLGSLKRIKTLRIGAGIRSDIRSRIPYYSSDWTDAWNYRVVPATTLIFFAKCDFSFIERPRSHGPFQCSSGNCLLSGPHRDYWKVWGYGSFTFFCNGRRGLLGLWRTAIVHSRRYGHVQLSQAPLSLKHSPPVAGPITVFNKTIYDILANTSDAPDYLQFMGWVYLWGAIFHWISALLNCR